MTRFVRVLALSLMAAMASGAQAQEAPPAEGAQPLEVDVVESSFFDDRARFPEGSIEFDCALLMRGTAHEWHARPSLAVRGLVPA